MALTILRTLEGVNRITETGQYEFSLPIKPNYTTLPNALDNVVLEEVYIIIEDTADEVLVVLPPIIDFNNAWNCKIYLVNRSKLAYVSVQRTDDPALLDEINFTNAIQLTPATTGYLHIVDNHLWAMWVTPISNPQGGNATPQPSNP